MTRRPRSKPKTPEQIAAERALRRAQDFEAVGLQPASSQLQAQANVLIERNSQRNMLRARRLDAFEALRQGMEVGAYDAARRLERDMTIRRGEHDRGPSDDRVDCEPQGDRQDRMIAAAQRIDRVLSRLSDRDAWLLTELIAPKVERDSWRAIVAHITGETHPHAQGAVVRAACVNLRDAYEGRARRAA